MKLTEAQQATVNEIARCTYAADRFGKAKTDRIKANKTLVEKCETAFREGVPVEFEYEGRVIRCRLVMTPCPKWSTRDIVLIEGEGEVRD